MPLGRLRFGHGPFAGLSLVASVSLLSALPQPLYPPTAPLPFHGLSPLSLSFPTNVGSSFYSYPFTLVAALSACVYSMLSSFVEISGWLSTNPKVFWFLLRRIVSAAKLSLWTDHPHSFPCVQADCSLGFEPITSMGLFTISWNSHCPLPRRHLL